MMWKPLLMAVLLTLAPQDTFKPGDTLSGYSTARSSRYSRLYDFKVYEAFRGLGVSRNQVSLLKDQWRLEKDRVAAIIAEIVRDPIAEAGFVMEGRISKHPYLRTLLYERVDKYPPFVFFIQKPPRAEASFVAANLAPYPKWMQRLELLFRTEYVEPLKLTTRAQPHSYGVFVLASSGDYLNFIEAKPVPSDGYGHYDNGLDMVIAYRNPRSNQPARSKRLPAMGDAVLAMLDAYGLPGPKRKDLFYSNGLAGYLTYHQNDNKEDLVRHRPNPKFVETVLHTLDNPKLADWRISLENLLTTTSKSGKLTGLAGRMGVSVSRDNLNYLHSQFEAHSTLWVHFLHQAERGRYKEAAGTYLTRVMSGEDGVATFKQVFGASDIPQLDEEFASYVRRLRDPAHVPVAQPADKPGKPAAESAATKTGFDTSHLAIEATDSRTLLAFALARASSGELSAAIQLLTTAQPEDGENKARAERAVMRLQALLTVRDAYIENLGKKGGKLRLTIDGERVNLRVEGVADGNLLLGRNKKDLERLAVDKIDLGELIGTLGKRVDEFGPAWVRAYVAVLSAEKRWKKYAGGDSAEERALLADGPDIAALLELGAAMRDMNAIATSKMATDARTANHAYGQLSALMTRHGSSPLLADKLGVLREYGRTLLDHLFAQEGLQDSLRVPVRDLGDGRIVIAYEFDQPEEALDFVEEVNYLPALHTHYASERTKPERGTYAVNKGTFFGAGWTCWTHKLAFQSPMTVRYEYYVGPMGSGDHSLATMRVGICDDGAGSYIGSVDPGKLVVIDRVNSFYIDRVDPQLRPHPESPIPMEIRHNGTTVETWADGEKRHDGSSGALKSGRVFLWTHTEMPIRFTRFEIEGTVSTKKSKSVIDAWANMRLAELGLHE